jgi:arginase
MQIQVIVDPYDSGQYGQRMGRGPLRFRDEGLPEALTAAGHNVRVTEVSPGESFVPEPRAAFLLHHRIAERVKDGEGFPLLLSGNCNACIGMLPGLGLPDIGIIWMDTHGDFNTPETSVSGFFDGMGLAAAAGRCWQAALGALPGFAPLPEAQIMHVGSRDLDADEARLMADSPLALIDAAQIQREGVAGALGPALDALRERVERVYLHLDLDVLDASIAPANQFEAPPGGLSIEQAEAVIREIGARFTLAGAGLASYDPAYDPDGRTLAAGIRLAGVMAEYGE